MKYIINENKYWIISTLALGIFVCSSPYMFPNNKEKGLENTVQEFKLLSSDYQNKYYWPKKQ